MAFRGTAPLLPALIQAPLNSRKDSVKQHSNLQPQRTRAAAEKAHQSARDGFFTRLGPRGKRPPCARLCWAAYQRIAFDHTGKHTYCRQ